MATDYSSIKGIFDRTNIVYNEKPVRMPNGNIEIWITVLDKHGTDTIGVRFRFEYLGNLINMVTINYGEEKDAELKEMP